ncbi:MAG: ribosome maturation factor RimP [Chromatiales bacterium]
MRQTAQLTELVRGVVEAMGYEMVGVELLSQGQRHSTLRVYIDSEDGITLDDCASVSHQLSGVLDVEEPISGNYNLEISSPGLDRPLFEEAHYDRFAGNEITVKMRVPVDGRKKFKGLLLGREAHNILMRVDGQELALPFSQIEKARLVPQL